MGDSGRFPRGKPAATESRYPTYSACWVFQWFHNPPNSGMDTRIFNVLTDVCACDCTRDCTDTIRKSLHWKLTLGEKSLAAHRGIESASAACRYDALPTELHPRPKSLCQAPVVCVTARHVHQSTQKFEGKTEAWLTDDGSAIPRQFHRAHFDKLSSGIQQPPAPSVGAARANTSSGVCFSSFWNTRRPRYKVVAWCCLCSWPFFFKPP